MEEPYHTTTRGLTVRVRPEYLADQSDPDERRWVWAYHVEVVNQGRETVQLISRHWIITDAFGRIQEVQGPGVIGQQPTLRPGDGFRYASGCPLPTSSGTMSGTYQMVTDGGERFDAAIPTFSLDVPQGRRVVN